MAYEFKLRRRVEFADTDMAGIMHFANFLRYMEVTEHAFIRSLGHSVHASTDDAALGWPRVHVSCDYKQPLRFEDEVEIHLLVIRVEPKLVEYAFVFRKIDNDAPGGIAAIGKMIPVCVAMNADTGRLRSTTIPADLATQLAVAPADYRNRCLGDETGG